MLLGSLLYIDIFVSLSQLQFGTVMQVPLASAGVH